VASNKVQNNVPDFQTIIQALVADVTSKYPVGPDLYLSGFSGGARMALGFALTRPVNGLILSGALAGAQELKQVTCPVYALSGTDDFNFLETAQYLFQEESTPTNLQIELTRSSHGWPDSLTLADAYTFVRTAGSTTTNEAFEKRQLAKIERLNAVPAKIMARWTARNMANTLPFSQNKAFATLDGQLRNSPGYADEMKRLLTNLQMETSVRDGYIKAFDSQNADWWTAELAKVNRRIETATDPFEQDAYRRIKGFWGIVCYSLCNRAVGSGDLQALKRYVATYRVLEPENPDMLRFSNMLH
jgi:pimeloyl-ACP methyl ester carboxylesterase